jgi:hypothetical protein
MCGRVFCLLFAIALGGCASLSGYPDNPVTVQKDVQALSVYFDPTKITDYQNQTDPTIRQMKRNDIAYGRMAAYDAEFSQFQQSLNAEGGFTDTAFDFTSLTLTAIGASPVATVTKTTVSAAATAVNGGRTSIDKNIYYSKTLPVLFAQMEANRATVRAIIIKGLSGKDADYPLGAALSDLETYRDAGSLPGAISGVANNAGDQKTQAQMAIMRLRGF